MANYRVSLLNKGNEEAYLYFIDCQDDIQDEQIAWIQSTANKPSYFFSFSPLYQRENFDIFRDSKLQSVLFGKLILYERGPKRRYTLCRD